ncbi:nicotinamide riboside transporter PnuC [Paenibacillus sp. CC-CFT747]|nr:nicotinamide riboside transporter PnuC [Paenibacillus sp. CC-CFT747]
MNGKYTMWILMAGMLLVAYLTSSTWLEIAATTTGLLSVWLTARQNMWCWPVSLVNVGLFFFTYFEAKLYADMTLQVLFFLLSIQGWIVWATRRGGAKVRPTSRITPKLTALLAVILIVVTFAWGHVLERFTDASIPYADAFIATLSIVAQLLLSSKILENWYVWIAVDVLSIGMFLYKELYVVAFLYLIFLGIATAGLISWRKDYRLAAEAAGPSGGSRPGAVV